jgi:parallel beta-helix repeat protein
MVTAINEATFMVEPYGSDLDNPTGFVVIQRFQDRETSWNYGTRGSVVSDMFDDIVQAMTRPISAGTNMKGGLLFLKNGTYLLEHAISPGDSTNGDNVTLRLIGESREGTIIKGGSTPDEHLLRSACSIDIENITFQGNPNVTIHGVSADPDIIPNKILKVKNCRFTNINGFDIIIGHNQNGLDISKCIFDNKQSTHDQMAFECTGYASIHDNIFDRTSGQTTGESLTSGTAFNANIHNNIVIRRKGDISNAISLEAFQANADYENVFVHNNLVYNGVINVGSPSVPWSTKFHNFVISSNIITRGGIAVQGPDNAPYTGLIRDLAIENNQLFDSWKFGILLYKVGGYNTIRNNTIKNSNASLDKIDFDKGAIYLKKTIDTVCENNNIYMGKVSPSSSNFSPFGIKYVDMENPTIVKNTILNRTSSNPSYVSTGKHSGKRLIVK